MDTTSFNSFKSQACWHARVTAILTDTTYHEKLLHSPLLQIGPEVRRRNSQHAICKSLFGCYIASFSGSYPGCFHTASDQKVGRHLETVAVSELPGYLGRQHMWWSHYVTAEFPRKTIRQNFAQAMPRLAQVWNSQCLEMRLSCYKYVTSRDSFETLTGN